MSAYIVQPEHAGLLAAYAVSELKNEYGTATLKQLADDRPEVAAQNVARCLIQENIRSVAHHYPNDTDGNRPGPANLTDAQIVEAAALWATHYVKHGELPASATIFKLCDSLEYQSCETDDWDTTLACKQLNAIRSRAAKRLPGYERAPWAWEDSNPELDALIWGETAN